MGYAKTSPTIILADPSFEIIAGDDAARFVIQGATGLIDPDNSADTAQDGSIDHPYDSFTDFSITSGYAYLRKRGTQIGFDGVVGDPLFVDPAKGDFRLQAGSPAIDSGLDAGYTVDMDGHPIPTGAAPDIGAYQYVE